jgi:hypothetical protein
LRHQIASFFAYKSSGQPFDVEIFALVLHIVTEILDGQTENTDMTDRQPVIDEWKQICENNDKVFSVFTDEILQEFHAWCMEQSAENQTFSFWDNFLYVDFMSI